MSDTKGIKKFVLAYEPYNSGNTQYLINFKLNPDNQYTFKHIKVEKYRGITTAKNGKFTLSEIDKMTAQFNNSNEFLKAAKAGYDIHDFFIGYSDKGYIKKIKVAFNNPSLLEKTKLVKGDVIIDKVEVAKIVHLLIDPKSKFYSYLKKHDEYNRSFNLTCKIEELRRMMKASEYETNFETTFVIRDLNSELTSEVRKYKNFRELFLAKDAYLKEETKQEERTVAKQKKLASLPGQITMAEYVKNK